MIKDLSVMIGGKAGDGVLFTGNVLARLLKRHGWEVATYRDFPSNIRGEATSYTIRASLGRVYGLSDNVDILLAFDCEAILTHVPHIANNGIVFCDGEEVKALPPEHSRGRTFHRISLRSMSKEQFGQDIFKNMMALGALSYVLDLDRAILSGIIEEMFLKRKGKEVVRKNVEAVATGYAKAGEITAEKERHPLMKRPDRDGLLVSGDEAIAFGALAAGCRFFAAYPICPASEISQWLVRYITQFNGVVVQTEDELAAMNMAVGAGYAGARAMTATSGPGASLMMEAFSLAGMTETPVVVAHVQRLGPSTGIPTKTQQGDILQWIFGSHGEFPRVVLSPGTTQECFDLTVRAFNLAEIYQCPVIVLTELDMGQNFRTTPRFDLRSVRIDRGKLLSQEGILRIEDFKRYEFTADGISPRSIPYYKNGLHLVESLEHDEKGYRNEENLIRVRMMEKRMRKLKKDSRGLVPPRQWGDLRARVGFVAAGSTLGAILEAMDALKRRKVQTKFLQLRTLWPFPSAAVKRFFAGCDEVFVVENNYSGQLVTLIKSQVNPCLQMRPIPNYSTRAFTPQQLVNPVMRVCR
jgi:2-oxoglutarate ferredoxin oxidoreductase subunit alpha